MHMAELGSYEFNFLFIDIEEASESIWKVVGGR